MCINYAIMDHSVIYVVSYHNGSQNVTTKFTDSKIADEFIDTLRLKGIKYTSYLDVEAM